MTCRRRLELEVHVNSDTTYPAWDNIQIPNINTDGY